MDITGVGQEELVCMLRSTRQGENVCLMVLRQEDMFLPREMVRTNHGACFSRSLRHVLLVGSVASFKNYDFSNKAVRKKGIHVTTSPVFIFKFQL